MQGKLSFGSTDPAAIRSPAATVQPISRLTGSRPNRRRLPSPAVLARYVACLTVAGLTHNATADEASQQLTKALTYKPRQADVRYELVADDKLSECSIEEANRGQAKGFLVSGPGGQPLRWFADTNQDNRLDRWSYYNAGVEVYRESDSNANGTADEYRWLSTEGMRWGIDQDEDGQIDSWKMISAEEVTAEAVRATAARDPEKFQLLLITEQEIRELGLGPEKAQLLLQRVADAKQQFQAWAGGQNVVSSSSKWTNFGADKPGIVPAGTDGSEKDVVVYENAVALLENAGEAKQLLVGTMIQVGSCWRLVDLPQGVSENVKIKDNGVFFSASFGPAVPPLACPRPASAKPWSAWLPNYRKWMPSWPPKMEIWPSCRLAAPMSWKN